MKAVVGLGNPGDDYKGTRHNVGFEVVDELAKRWDAKLKKWKATAAAALVKDRDILLAEPTTFMNDSGRAVNAIMSYYKMAPQDVLVVVDEAQLPLGRLRLRPSGSAGGHNGLKSVIEHVGSEFPRLRIGIDRGHRDWDLSDRVLSRFPPVERPAVDEAIQRAADAIEVWADFGIHVAMNRFNAAGDNQSEIN
jgi:PTH1 family peptidyl-tRNA hydrolase